MIVLTSLFWLLIFAVYILCGMIAGLLLKEYGANKPVRFIALFLWPFVLITAAVWGLIKMTQYIFEG